jgi:hypothetical protein
MIAASGLHGWSVLREKLTATAVAVGPMNLTLATWHMQSAVLTRSGLVGEGSFSAAG